ncbi:MAG: hypothetical protein NTW26_09565 [bacterium]|nr:hypothetical protein [bacterium]
MRVHLSKTFCQGHYSLHSFCQGHYSLHSFFPLMLILAVPVFSARLSAVYVPDSDTDVIFTLDDAGQLYQGEAAGWNAVNTPCPGAGPRDLLVLNRTDVSASRPGTVNIFVLDGAGQLYEVNGDEWRPEGDALAGESPYRLGGYAAADGGVELYALDSGGRLWRYGDTWEAFADPIIGTPPYDLDVLHYATTGVTLFLAVDAIGALYTRFDDNWKIYAVMLDTEVAPYSVTGFYEPTSLNVFVLVMDGAGQVHSDEGGSFVTLGEPFPGEPPFEVGSLVHEGSDRYYVAALDGTGRFCVMREDGGWETFFDSF